MSLMSQASHVYAEHGEEGLRRWEERLTAEQRAAMVHEWDQFCAAFSDMTDSIQELPALFDRMATAVGDAVRELSALSASSDASSVESEGTNDAP